MRRTILVVDDESEIRSTLQGVLKDEGYQVFLAHDRQTALELANQEKPDLILLDVWMTTNSGERQQEGLAILGQLKLEIPDATVVVMSGHGNIETAVKATKLGAFDFLEKPLSLDKLLLTVQNALQMRDLTRENQNLRARVAKSKMLIATSPAMKSVIQQIKRVGPTNAWALITGENGTGKELVAHSIHAASTRFDGPFIEVNCAAIPEELIESELFGHEKGAFTGAIQQKRGKFEVADGGTLFLDEIADMSLKTQAKILRILQEQKFERVGGNQTIHVDVRVIAATNKDLELEIKKGSFREDLYYRLNVIPFKVPPLRDRKEDIVSIAEYFTKEFSGPSEREKKRLLPAAAQALTRYSWPGNVRELKNFIERLVIFSDQLDITEQDVISLLPLSGQVQVVEQINIVDDSLTLKDAKSEFEKDFILRKLKENEWNVSKTAQALGVERSHLHKKIKAYGIEETIDDSIK